MRSHLVTRRHVALETQNTARSLSRASSVVPPNTYRQSSTTTPAWPATPAHKSLGHKKIQDPRSIFPGLSGRRGNLHTAIASLATARRVRGAGFMKQYAVSQSIHSSVCVAHSPGVAGLLLWAGRVRDIDRLVHGWRFSRTAHSSKCQQCQVSSICRQLNGLFVACPFGAQLLVLQPNYRPWGRTARFEAELLSTHDRHCFPVTERNKHVFSWRRNADTDHSRFSSVGSFSMLTVQRECGVFKIC